MDNDVKIQITTSANTQGVKQADQALDNLGTTGGKSAGFMDRLSKSLGPIAGISAAAGASLYSLTGFMGSSIQAANDLQGSLMGLNSIANAFSQDAGEAKDAAQSLAEDGLMTVADAATGLKNLLAAGFNLDQAITLMNRFKDSASFSRQASLSFGDSIRGATEGIKNGNSILVDNAGVTKNLSMMLTDAGYSAQDLMKASSDSGVRQAIFNGILKETNAQLGDAAKYADSAAGQQAKLAAETTKAKAEFGKALNEALLPMIKALTPIISAIGKWIGENQKLAAGIAIAMVVFLALIAVIGAVLLIVAAIAAVFGAVSAGVVAAVVAIVAAVAAAVAYIVMNFQQVIDFFKAIPAAIGKEAGRLADIIKKPFVDSFNFIKSLPDKIVDLFTGMGGMIRKVIGNIDIPGPLGKIKDTIPGFATGTGYAPGGMALVGERGPELVNLPRGSQVYSNPRTESMLGQGGGGGTTSITIQNAVFNTADAVNEFFALQNRNSVLASKGLATIGNA